MLIVRHLGTPNFSFHWMRDPVFIHISGFFREPQEPVILCGRNRTTRLEQKVILSTRETFGHLEKNYIESIHC